MFISHTPVDQQDGHVDNVEVRENVAETTGGTVGQGAHQVAGVVEVARHSPETWGQELAAVGAAVGGQVRALDVGGLATPDGADAVRAAEQVFLMVGGAEDVIPNQTKQQYGEGVGVWELDWVVHQVQALKDRFKGFSYC